MDERTTKIHIALINVRAYLNLLNRQGFPTSISTINEIIGRKNATERELKVAASTVVSATAHIRGRSLDDLRALVERRLS